MTNGDPQKPPPEASRVEGKDASVESEVEPESAHVAELPANDDAPSVS